MDGYRCTARDSWMEAAEVKRHAPHNESREMVHIIDDITDPKTRKRPIDKAMNNWRGLDIFISNTETFKAAEFLS